MNEKPLSYGSYLKVPELISLQQLRSQPHAHDEMLFIVIHQVYELWFKLSLFEMRHLIRVMQGSDFIDCFRTSDRLAEIFKVLVQQVDVLETMTATEFNAFRNVLKPASGFQSQQFRELEILCGGSVADYGETLQFAEWKDELNAVSKEVNLRTAFFKLLKSPALPPDTTQALKEIYTNPQHGNLYNLCEHLLGFDEIIQLWRFRHVQMVERMIGQKPGTGGSLGVRYLQSTLQKRIFPELWDVRTQLQD